MKLLILLLTLSLSACVSIQEQKEANVTPQLTDNLDEDNYKNEDDNMGIAIGNCKGLENSDYCDSLKRNEENNQKQLDESLKKHSKKEN